MAVKDASAVHPAGGRRVARTLIGLGFVVAAVLGPVAGGAGAAEDPPTVAAVTMVLQKEIVGPAQTGSSVQLRCENNNDLVFNLTFAFDAAGNATTSDAPDGYATIVDGDWVMSGTPKDTVSWTCYATETDTGGAASTSFTCDYDSGDNPADGFGCALAGDPSPGPAKVLFATPGDVKIQQAQITFTNTYVTVAAAEVTPTFTG